MLIKCSECGKEISDKSNQCIYCGCPIKQQYFPYVYNGVEYDIQKIIKEFTEVSPYNVNIIISVLNLADDISEDEICYIHDDIIRKYCPDLIEKCFSYSYADEAKENNIPKCPTCSSTNIEKISLTKKAVGGALFGLFSSNVRNTMHCKNCGAKW